MTDPDRRERGRHLVEEAFDVARATGKPDWFRMRAAVLKNRILDLTDRTFNEADHGASSFVDFVSSYPEIVSVDRSVDPPWVMLRSYEAEANPYASSTASDSSASQLRIRPDLWRAVVDYRSGITRFWDPVTGSVSGTSPAAAPEPNEPGRSDSPEPDGGELAASAWDLPTLTPQELAQWREEFVQEVGQDLPEDARAKLERWQAEALGTQALPAQLRGRWNEGLKRRVAERLSQWFRFRGQEPPNDLLRPVGRSARQDASQSLREFILSCVKQMTEDELRALHLPVTSIARMRRLN